MLSYVSVRAEYIFARMSSRVYPAEFKINSRISSISCIENGIENVLPTRQDNTRVKAIRSEFSTRNKGRKQGILLLRHEETT